MTSIEWTQGDDGSKGETWNPVVGCRRVSPGCQNCYAETMAYRLEKMGQERYRGLTVLGKTGRRWSGEVRLVPEALAKPLGWRKPRRIFVNSMSDLFHEDVPNDYIAAVFGVMAACPQHTFQILTKRPKRALEWFCQDDVVTRVYFFKQLALADRCAEFFAPERERPIPGFPGYFVTSKGRILTSRGSEAWTAAAIGERYSISDTQVRNIVKGHQWQPTEPHEWPLMGVWMGVSTENQETADERIPFLLQCPAAVKFVSAEPLLGPVDFDKPHCQNCYPMDEIERAEDGTPWCMQCDSEACYGMWLDPLNGGLSWVIVGGESGRTPRPFQVEWARSIKKQCQEAHTPFFLKQLGGHVRWDGTSGPGERWPPNRERAAIDDELPGWRMQLHDRKGKDIAEWPEDLRVRQFPEVQS